MSGALSSINSTPVLPELHDIALNIFALKIMRLSTQEDVRVCSGTTPFYNLKTLISEVSGEIVCVCMCVCMCVCLCTERKQTIEFPYHVIT